jgi:hypothetical protein
MTYRAIYRADGWQACRHPLLPHATEECQIVRQALGQGQQLSVELTRQPGAAPRIVVARLEVPFNRHGRPDYRTARVLAPDEIELVTAD